jgi:hypothetical protein
MPIKAMPMARQCIGCICSFYPPWPGGYTAGMRFTVRSLLSATLFVAVFLATFSHAARLQEYVDNAFANYLIVVSGYVLLFLFCGWLGKRPASSQKKSSEQH